MAPPPKANPIYATAPFHLFMVLCCLPISISYHSVDMKTTEDVLASPLPNYWGGGFIVLLNIQSMITNCSDRLGLSFFIYTSLDVLMLTI